MKSPGPLFKNIVMKVKMIKPHHLYEGTVDVPEERANYLIAVGAAKEVKEAEKPKKTKTKK